LVRTDTYSLLRFTETLPLSIAATPRPQQMALGSRSAIAFIAAASLALLCGYDLVADNLGTSVRDLAQKHWWKQRQQWRRRHERNQRLLENVNGLHSSRFLPKANRIAVLIGTENEPLIPIDAFSLRKVDEHHKEQHQEHQDEFEDKQSSLHEEHRPAEKAQPSSKGSLQEFPTHEPKKSTRLDDHCIETTVTVFAEVWGNEIGLKIDDTELVVEGSLANNQVYLFNMCLSAGVHEAILTDSYGDGWHGGYLRINGVDYGRDFLTGTIATHTFSIIGCIEMIMTVTSTIGANEIGLLIDGTEIVAMGSLANHQVYTYSVCLTVGAHMAALLDSYGDGWHGGYLTINGVDYGKEFLGGASQTHTFIVVEAVAGGAPWPSSLQPSPSPFPDSPSPLPAPAPAPSPSPSP
jgi:hypothetical protein